MFKSDLNKLSHGLVEFSVFSVKDTSVFFFDKNLPLSEEEVKTRFSLISDHPDATSKSVKYIKAERYGGAQISLNGGGARCGFDGEYQLKGIGPNCLVGKGVPYFYSNGHLPLEDALYEMLWSRIINESFPYGAVKAVAVIDLNIYCETPTGKSKRAILVREPAIRPAHFERATYFKPRIPYLASLGNDAVRVKNVIQLITDFFPKPDGLSALQWTEFKLHEQFLIGMHEMVTRFGNSLAFAVSRNIFHGALSSSNVAIDGRWLDFGCITMLPFPNFFENFVPKEVADQHLVFMECIDNLCFYAHKYLGIDKDISIDIISIARKAFHKSFNEKYKLYVLDELGFPNDLIDSIESSEESNILFNALEKVKLTGLGKYDGTEHWLLDKVGNKITCIAMCLAIFKDRNICDHELQKYIDSEQLRKLIIDSYLDFQILILKKIKNVCFDISHLRKYMALNVLIKSKRELRFRRDHIIDNINSILKICDHDEKKQFFEDYVEDMTLLSNICLNNSNSRLLCWSHKDERVYYDMMLATFVVISEGKKNYFLWDELLSSHNSTLDKMVDFLGKKRLILIRDDIQ